MEIIFKLSEQGESEWCLPGLFLMPDLHAVTTLLFDWFRYKSVFISAAFDSLHHLLLSFKLFSPFLFFFFWWNVPTCSLFQQSSLDSCVCCKERTLANRHAAFVRGTRHFHLFSFFPSLLMKGTINLAILPLLKHTSVDVLCFFWT